MNLIIMWADGGVPSTHADIADHIFSMHVQTLIPSMYNCKNTATKKMRFTCCPKPRTTRARNFTPPSSPSYWPQ